MIQVRILCQIFHALGELWSRCNDHPIPRGKILFRPLGGILQNRQRCVGGSIAVAGIKKIFLQLREIVHGSHHVNLAGHQHLHQGVDLCIGIPLDCYKFIIPVCIQTEVFQIVDHMPTASKEIIEKGAVSLAMLSKLGLQDIQVRLLPAETMYRHYIDHTKMDICTLNL